MRGSTFRAKTPTITRSISSISGGIIGVSKISGERILNEIHNSFYNHDKIKKIFNLENNRMKIKPVIRTELIAAIQGQNVDVRALANAYYLASNASVSHYVDMTLRNESLSNRVINALSNIQEIDIKPNDKGIAIDNQCGGGVNIWYNGGTLTVVVLDSRKDISDFTYAPNGTDYARYSTPAELLAHELLGHGYGRIIGSSTYRHEDAVRMSNLYWRARGYHNFYRNGTSHGTKVLLTKTSANQIPSHFII